MKMKSSLLAGLMATATAAQLGAPFATAAQLTEVGQEHVQSIEIGFTVPEHVYAKWAVTIPSSFDFQDENEVVDTSVELTTIEGELSDLNPGLALSVGFQSVNFGYLMNDNNDQISYRHSFEEYTHLTTGKTYNSQIIEGGKIDYVVNGAAGTNFNNQIYTVGVVSPNDPKMEASAQISEGQDLSNFSAGRYTDTANYCINTTSVNYQ